VTKLDKPLRREIEIDSRLYTLVLGAAQVEADAERTPAGHRGAMAGAAGDDRARTGGVVRRPAGLTLLGGRTGRSNCEKFPD
jgi:hypothetical protein